MNSYTDDISIKIILLSIVLVIFIIIDQATNPEESNDCKSNSVYIIDTDLDGDNISDEIDNCKYYFNPLQEDFNQDGNGNVCEGINHYE
jgi:hypothetical protein